MGRSASANNCYGGHNAEIFNHEEQAVAKCYDLQSERAEGVSFSLVLQFFAVKIKSNNPGASR
jgi:hypothetical protein